MVTWERKRVLAGLQDARAKKEIVVVKAKESGKKWRVYPDGRVEARTKVIFGLNKEPKWEYLGTIRE